MFIHVRYLFIQQTDLKQQSTTGPTTLMLKQRNDPVLIGRKSNPAENKQKIQIVSEMKTNQGILKQLQNQNPVYCYRLFPRRLFCMKSNLASEMREFILALMETESWLWLLSPTIQTHPSA